MQSGIFNLKVTRIMKGITQEQLAEMIGVSQPRISQIERGKKLPNDEERKKIEKILGKVKWN